MYSEVRIPHINKTEVLICSKKLSYKRALHYISASQINSKQSISLSSGKNLDEKKSAARAVLANVLEESNGRYRSQSAFRNALDELYGTVFYTDVAKRGETHIVSLC